MADLYALTARFTGKNWVVNIITEHAEARAMDPDRNTAISNAFGIIDLETGL